MIWNGCLNSASMLIDWEKDPYSYSVLRIDPPDAKFLPEMTGSANQILV